MDIEDIKGKTGLKTAVAEMLDRDVLPEGEEAAEQSSFLPDLPLDEGVRRAGVKTGRGRPPGAKNKNQQVWREYWLSKYRHPVEGLMAAGSCSIQQFAAALGYDFYGLTFDQRIELFKLQMMAMKEASPYVGQKLPQELIAPEGGLFQLVINNTAAQAAGIENAGNVAFQVLNEQVEENQLVSDADFSEMSQSRHSEELSHD